MNVDDVLWMTPPRGGGTCDNGQSETGPRANEIRPLDRCNLEMEGSGPMAIMPEADSTEHPPPTSALGRIDGCPKCVVNAEPPRDVRPTATGYLAAYLCSDCGHAWLTSWRD